MQIAGQTEIARRRSIIRCPYIVGQLFLTHEPSTPTLGPFRMRFRVVGGGVLSAGDGAIAEVGRARAEC